MKRPRFVFAIAAFVFAFATAFANISKPAIDYGYLDGTVCEPAQVSCSGTARACVKSVSGSDRDIRIWNNATSCGAVQTMD